MDELFDIVADFNKVCKTPVRMRDLTGEGRPITCTVQGETYADANRTEQLMAKMDKVTFSRKRVEGTAKDQSGNEHGAPRAQYLGAIAAERFATNNANAAALAKHGCETIAEYNAKRAEFLKAKKNRKGKPAPELHTVVLPAETPAETVAS